MKSMKMIRMRTIKFQMTLLGKNGASQFLFRHKISGKRWSTIGADDRDTGAHSSVSMSIDDCYTGAHPNVISSILHHHRRGVKQLPECIEGKDLDAIIQGELHEA